MTFIHHHLHLGAAPGAGLARAADLAQQLDATTFKRVGAYPSPGG